jgi:threonine/homoserine/homoserine lactone efflux protein
LDSLFPAWISGMICGFVASIGVGPVNLTVVEQGMRRGFRGAIMSGFGAITAETIYAVLALAGHAQFLPRSHKVHVLLQIAAAGVVVFLGLRYLFFRPQEERLLRMAHKVDERWHHPRAWALGFLVTLSNLSLILIWATLTTMLYTHGWVDATFPSRAACAGGIFLGGMIWYSAAAAFVSRAHRMISIGQLTLLQRICGVIFLVFAIYLLTRVRLM